LTAGVNKVTWVVITGADYYEVYTSATESGTYAFSSVTRGTEQAVEGTEYYKVKAVGVNGDVSALSTAATKSA
jgi:hypothetical protein